MTKIVTKTVTIAVKEGEEGLFYATSEEIPGLLVAASAVSILKKTVQNAIKELYAVKGIKTNIRSVTHSFICEFDMWEE